MLGPTGVGKSFVACVLAQKACRDGYSALYIRAQSLFRDLVVIDDWAMAPLSEPERRDVWEICEDR